MHIHYDLGLFSLHAVSQTQILSEPYLVQLFVSTVDVSLTFRFPKLTSVRIRALPQQSQAQGWFLPYEYWESCR